MIGTAIARARKRAGMTRAELQLRTGIAYMTLYRIETGNSNPTVNTLRKIADALGVDICELLRD